MALPDNRAATAQDGFGLVTVLLIILAIAAILTPVTTRVKTESLRSAALLHVEQLDALARSISMILVSDVISRSGREGPAPAFTNSALRRCHVGLTTVDFSLQDHTGLIDLNRASEDLLRDGFRSLDYDAGMASRLARAVVSFRTYNQSVTDTGGPDIVGGLKKAPFETVSELFDIRELRRISLKRLARTFTTYSDLARVALNTAPTDLVELLARGDDTARQRGRSTMRRGGALTASVRIAKDGFEGRFNGVYRTVSPASLRLLETWRPDTNEAEDPKDEGNCSDRFGTAFVDLVERTD